MVRAMSVSHDSETKACDLGKFGRIVVVFWISTLATAIAVCAGFVYLVGVIMQIGGFHAP